MAKPFIPAARARAAMSPSADPGRRVGRRRVLAAAGAAALLPAVPATAAGTVEDTKAARKVEATRAGRPDEASPYPPETRWWRSFDADRTVAATDGSRYLALVDGDLLGIDPMDGSVGWVRADASFGDEFIHVRDGVGYLWGGRRLRAFDPVGGEPQWTVETRSDGTSIHVDDGRVAVAGLDGSWRVVDVEDGEAVQSGRVDGSWAGIVGFHDGRVLVGGAEHPLSAFRLDDGGVDWSLDVPTAWSWLDGDRLFVGTGVEELHRVSPADGDIRWTYEGRAFRASTVFPYLRGEVLFAVSSGTLARLDPETGREWWSFSEEALYAPYPEGMTDDAVFTAVGGHVYGLDLATGERRWHDWTEGYRASLTFAYDTLFVGARGRLFAYAPDGVREWERELEGPDGRYARPRLATFDGVVLARNGSHLAGIDVNLAPEASLAVEPAAPAAGEPVHLTATDVRDRESGTDELTFVWDLGDGRAAIGREVTHAYGAGGSFDVTLEVLDPAGATATASTTVEVEPGETPSASPTASTGVPGFGALAAAGGLAGAATWLLSRGRDEDDG